MAKSNQNNPVLVKLLRTTTSNLTPNSITASAFHLTTLLHNPSRLSPRLILNPRIIPSISQPSPRIRDAKESRPRAPKKGRARRAAKRCAHITKKSSLAYILLPPAVCIAGMTRQGVAVYRLPTMVPQRRAISGDTAAAEGAPARDERTAAGA